MDTWHYTAPFVGGVVLEAIYWFELKEKMHLKRYRKMITSPFYWGPVVAMIVIGGLAGIYWGVSQDPTPSPWELLIAGAAIPSLVKAAVAALTASKKTDLGPGDDLESQQEPRVSWRDYFSPG